MAGLFSQLYWPKLLKYLPRLLLHTFNDKYISVCVCLALDFIAACPAHFSHSLLLHLCGTKERSSLRLDCYAMSRLYLVSYFRLFLSSLQKQQKQRRKTTSGVRRGGGGCKSLRYNGTHCVAGAPTSQENFMPFVSIVLVFMPEILLFSGTI